MVLDSKVTRGASFTSMDLEPFTIEAILTGPIQTINVTKFLNNELERHSKV